MSTIKLQGAVTGTANFTVTVPSGTSTDRTFTLPDSTGTLLNDASSLAAANLTGDVAAARITSALNASGSAPVYACRAWVNFNGTGTVEIRASGNVSSITDNGTGDYTVNFTTAMPDANYSASGICMGGGGSTNTGQFVGAPQTTTGTSVSALRIAVRYCTNGTLNDVDTISVQVFR